MADHNHGEIAQVIAQLEGIVDTCRAVGNRVGYFAAMYLTVTRKIATSIDEGVFTDAKRMTQLDVIFARRFIVAFSDHAAGRQVTASWALAFEGATKWRPIVVQQLLVGMNAHINLDLGIASAAVAPGAAVTDLHGDFNKINEVLASMTQDFTSVVAAVSPWIGLLDRIGGQTDQHLIRFSIDVARDAAWQLAIDLADDANEAAQAPIIDARDRWTAEFGETILHPGWLMSAGLLVVRARETRSVRDVIDALASPNP